MQEIGARMEGKQHAWTGRGDTLMRKTLKEWKDFYSHVCFH